MLIGLQMHFIQVCCLFWHWTYQVLTNGLNCQDVGSEFCSKIFIERSYSISVKVGEYLMVFAESLGSNGFLQLTI